MLNLSHPKGQYLNDYVNKCNFDIGDFTLKLPSVDDILERSLQVEDPLMFIIDIARAFRNLRVDPLDALKFDLSECDVFYVNTDIVFGIPDGGQCYLTPHRVFWLKHKCLH